jgi:ABC-type transport system involved in cytochrome c biogenesis permease subunit
MSNVMPPARLPVAGLLIGGTAALIATVAMLVLGEFWGTPVVPQLLADRVIALIPVGLFGSVLANLEAGAKPLALVGLTLLLVIVGGVVGGLLARKARRGASPPALFLPVAAATWLVLAFLAVPVGGIGPLGKASSPGRGQLRCRSS